MARRRPAGQLRRGAPADALVLDSGAVTAATRGHVRVRAELAVAEQLGVSVHVSSVVLAEVLRDPRRDARIHALLQAITKDSVTPEQGRAAGELLGRVGGDDTIDSIVAIGAQAAGQRVRLLTGDVSDLQRLTGAMSGVTVVRI